MPKPKKRLPPLDKRKIDKIREDKYNNKAADYVLKKILGLTESTYINAYTRGEASDKVRHKMEDAFGLNRGELLAKEYQVSPSDDNDNANFKEAQEESLERLVCKKWYGAHFGRRNGKPSLIRTALTIEKGGSCSLEFSGEKFRYTGRVHIEEATNFVIVLDPIKKMAYKEKMAIRGQMAQSGADEFSVTWLALDTLYGIYSSNGFFSKTEIQEKDVITKIGDAHTWIGPEEVVQQWDEKLICKTIKESSPGETLHLFSTYYPEFDQILHALSELQSKLNNKVKIYIYFLAADSELVKIRFACFENTRLREHADDVIADQIDRIRQFAKNNGNLEITIKEFHSWPFGRCFMFGNRICFYAPMLTDNTAMTAPMTICHFPESRLWQRLKKNLETILAAK